MAMEAGIHKYGEQQPTNGLERPSAKFNVGLGRCDVGICRCNTPGLACHLSYESAQSHLAAVRFVGECLSDMYSFDSVDAYTDMHAHAYEHIHAGIVRRSLPLSPFVAQGFLIAPLGNC